MNKSLLLCLLFLTTCLFSQTKQENEVYRFVEQNPYLKKDGQELFFLHTNKTLYFSGEKVWFSAYILDAQKEIPAVKTKNLHINLYDTNFKLIAQKLYYVNNGKATGQFALSGKLSSGKYYLQLDTNWNRNFGKGTPTEIEIVNLEQDLEEGSEMNSSIYAGEPKVKVNKVKHEFLIQRSLNTPNSGSFKIRTTENIVKKYNGNTLFVVLHKNGHLKSCAQLNVSNKKSYTVNFNEEYFLNGTNTITLFDTNNAILAEKHFWNFTTTKEKLQIENKIIKEDTLFVHLKLPKHFTAPSLSVSVLNAETELNTNQKNILSSFIDVDFSKMNTSKQKDTLLNDRKTKLSFSNASYLKGYKREKGITLKGKVNYKKENIKGFKIGLSSQENEIFLVNPLNKNRSFEFNNLYLKHPTKYKLTLLNKKGEDVAASFYMYNNLLAYKSDSLITVEKTFFKTKSTQQDLFKNNIRFNKNEDYVELKEVVIKSFVNKEKKMRKKYKNLIGAAFSNFYIPDENLGIGTDIFFYLGNIPGLRISYPPLSSSPLLFSTRGPRSLSGSQLVNVKLDGVFLGDDLLALTGLLTSDFEVIMVNLNGAGEGIRGSNGVVNLILRTDAEYVRKNNPTKAIIKETTGGYEISLKKYTKSNIKFNDTKLEQAYGAITWFGNVKIDATNKAILKIPVSKKHKNITLEVNGFDKNGNLIHQKINIVNE